MSAAHSPSLDDEGLDWVGFAQQRGNAVDGPLDAFGPHSMADVPQDLKSSGEMASKTESSRLHDVAVDKFDAAPAINFENTTFEVASDEPLSIELDDSVSEGGVANFHGCRVLWSSDEEAAALDGPESIR